MEANICPRCGEALQKEGDIYRCTYCGATCEEHRQDQSAANLRACLDEVKIERLANARRLLWSASHETYPSKEKVIASCREVLSLHAEEYLAAMYLHSHDRDPIALTALLANADVSPSEAGETYRWLLPSLSPRVVGALHDFIDRHYKGEEKTKKITALEDEAAKVFEGVYEAGLPRDVFLCYSSLDMPKVIRVMDLLEQNGFAVFAAFRNLRHGKGAQEDYLLSLRKAMKACGCFLFLSSESSRAMTCDAMRVELPYLISDLPEKPRIEYLLEDYENVPFLARMTLKKAFPSQEHCRDEEDLLLRIHTLLHDQGKKQSDSERLQREVAKAKKEAEEAKALAKEAERRRQQALAEAKPSSQPAPQDEETLRRQAEEKVRQDLLRERLEQQARERLLEDELIQKEAAAKEKERAKREAGRKAREKQQAMKQAKRKALDDAIHQLRSNYNTPRYEDGYLIYGAYPSRKAEHLPELKEAVRELEADANGYVPYDDKVYFRKALNDYYLMEPLKWLIFHVEGNEALAISKDIIDCQAFGYSGIEYTRSPIKDWLNNVFLPRAYDDLGAHLLNAIGKQKVSLLSLEDNRKQAYGFDTLDRREASPTDYANAIMASSKGSNADYLTRTTIDSSSVAGIGVDGRVNEHCPIGSPRGVRPFIRVKLPEDVAAKFHRVQHAAEAKKQEKKEAAKAKRDAEKAELAAREAKRAKAAKDAHGTFRRWDITEPRFEYGEYPQGKIEYPDTVKALKALRKGDKEGFVEYEGNRYASRGSSDASWYLFEPIDWKIIARKGNEALAVSTRILDDLPKFDWASPYVSNRVRDYLNGPFLSFAFPDKSRLLPIKVGGIFGPKDLIALMDEDTYFKCIHGKSTDFDWPTSYAGYYGCSSYLIRLASGNGGLAAVENKNVVIENKEGNSKHYGLRPMIKIKL